MTDLSDPVVGLGGAQVCSEGEQIHGTEKCPTAQYTKDRMIALCQYKTSHRRISKRVISVSEAVNLQTKSFIISIC